MTAPDEVRLTFDDQEAVRALLGARNAHLRLLAETVGVQASSRGGVVGLRGSPEETGLARQVLTQLYELICQGYPIYEMDVDFAVRILAGDPGA
jgi:phosphate starvation-inducible PhoH-like protein